MFLTVCDVFGQAKAEAERQKKEEDAKAAAAAAAAAAKAEAEAEVTPPLLFVDGFRLVTVCVVTVALT